MPDPHGVEAIFHEALTRPDSAARAAYLNETCGQDTGLRQEVEALLLAHDRANTFLSLPVSATVALNCWASSSS